MSTTTRNPEATRLRNRIRQDHADHDDCKFLADLDAALATERRNLVERIRRLADEWRSEAVSNGMMTGLVAGAYRGCAVELSALLDELGEQRP